MTGHKGQRLGQLARRAGHVHAEPLASARVDEIGAQDQVGGGDGGAHEVVGAHHLRARIGLERAKDVVLGAVGQAVEQQVDGEKEHAPRHVALLIRGRVLLGLLSRVQRKDGDARRHGRHHQVLVQRVALAEDGNVQEHDGQQLARLGQQEGDVVDMRQAGVAKGRRERLCQGHKHERRQDAPRRENGRDRGVSRRAEVQVDGTTNGGKEGLDRVQENGVLEHLGVAFGAVRCRCEALLKEGPRQAVRQASSQYIFLPKPRDYRQPSYVATYKEP